MSFEIEKKGLQIVAETITLAMSRGAFGFDDIERLGATKQGIQQQYALLEGGLAAVIGGQQVSESTPKLAIPQPPQEDIIEEPKSSKTKK